MFPRFKKLKEKPRVNSMGGLPSYFGVEGSVLERVIDDLPVAVFAKDASNDFRFVLWNKKQEEITTISKQAALGRNDAELFSDASADYYREVDESVIERGRLVDVPEEIIETQAGEVWVHTLKVPVVDERSGKTLLVGISEDITERVKVRLQLEKLNRNLHVTNRELKETQLQLIQAEKMESVGRLAAGVAHEVKNPLALLLLGVEYLSSGVKENDPNIDEILAEMREAIERADKIIRGLVDFSSERQISVEPVDLTAVVEHSLLLVRHELTRSGVGVEMEYEKGLPKVLIDQSKFQQVLVNLIMNATHAMRDTPTPQLEVLLFRDTISEWPRDEGLRTASHLRNGDAVVVLEFKDNGRGIPEDLLLKVFDPFFTTKAAGEGTGLGLSVVRKIVELHGGMVSIRNRQSGGASIRITLRAYL